MPKVVLKTDMEVKALSRVPGVHAVGGVSGLVLRARKGFSGVVSALWFYRYRREGRRLKFCLGSYETVSLKSARDKAREYKEFLDNGGDAEELLAPPPQEEWRDKTFGVLFEEWIAFLRARGQWDKGKTKEQLAQRKKDPYKTEFSRARKHLTLLWPMDVTRITTEDIRDAFLPIWCNHVSTSDRLLGHVNNFFGWVCDVERIREDNPSEPRRLRRILPVNSKRKQAGNYAYLDPDEVPALVRILWSESSEASLCLLYSILTALRSGNAREARWDRVKALKVNGISVPSMHYKAREMKVPKNGDHTVPLSPEAIRVIERMRPLTSTSPYIFESSRKHHEPLSDTALNNALQRIHDAEVREGRKGWVDPVTKARATQHGISRGSFTTWAIRNRKEERTIEQVLHHEVDSRYNGAYDRDDGLENKYALLCDWGKYCFSLIDESGKVHL